MGGRRVRYGWIGGRREKVRGVYRFSSLVKQNKKAKICFVIDIAGEKKLLFYIYFVIVKQKIINGPLITTYIGVSDGDSRESGGEAECSLSRAIDMCRGIVGARGAR